MNSSWEKCDQKFCYGQTDKQTDRQTMIKQYTPFSFGAGEQKKTMQILVLIIAHAIVSELFQK